MATAFELQKEQELRVEVDHSTSVEITGTAECYGSEMAPRHKYTIAAGSKLAIYTYHGCHLEVNGKARVAYVGKDTPMIIYSNIHNKLQEMRAAAAAGTSKGPRVLVCGPTDSGKSTLCRVLVNYAVRESHRPMFVDLDVGQGQLTVPGALCATPVTRPIAIDDGPPISMPLCHFFGYANVGANTALFAKLVQRMAATLDEQCEIDTEARAAGQIINTCGWVDGEGYSLLVQSIQAFQVDLVLVLSDEKLAAQLTNDLKEQANKVNIVRLQKSGGVVARDKNFRRRARMHRVREYFYGPKNQFSPDLRTVPFADIRVFKIASEGNQADASALPIGMESNLDPLAPTEITPTKELMHSLLVVTYAESPEQLVDSSAAGFVHVQEVDTVNERITILSPCPGPLPGNFMLVGDVKWMETEEQ